MFLVFLFHLVYNFFFFRSKFINRKLYDTKKALKKAKQQRPTKDLTRRSKLRKLLRHEAQQEETVGEEKFITHHVDVLHLPPVPETSRDDGAPPNRRGKPNKKLLKPNSSHRKSQTIRLIWQIERFGKENNCFQSI